jgi:hypothetical protein
MDWEIAENGWAIETDRECADPQKNQVGCQIFRVGSELTDNNVGGLTAEEIIELSPSIVEYLSDGVFTRNVILKTVGD